MVILGTGEAWMQQGNRGHGQLFQGPRCRQTLLSYAGLLSITSCKVPAIQL